MQTAETFAPPPPCVQADLIPLLLPVKDTAKVLGVSPRSVWKLIAGGALQTRKIGCRTLVTMESVRHVAGHGA